MFKKAILISTLALSFSFFGCSSEEDTIKSLALEQCKKYAEHKSKGDKPDFEKVLNIEIIGVKPNNFWKGTPMADNVKDADCRIKAILARDNYDSTGKLQKKGSEVEIKRNVTVTKEKDKWEASYPNV